MNLKTELVHQEVKTKSASKLRLEKYNDKNKALWNQFIAKSKNGTFLFNRDYMEYHSDRFEDFSLMFFNGNKLIAVMPANIENNELISHGGLTYGGIISDNKMSTYKMLKVFDILKESLKNNGIEKLIYKAVPHIYHTIPAEEDLYALFRNNAKLIRRDISSSIPKDERLNFTRQKRRNIKRCRKSGLEIQRDYDFEAFMGIKKKDLKKKYGVNPVHTAVEMKLLAERFPENIKLFTARENNEILAGIIIYESKNVAHGQYLASTGYGKEINAADFIKDFLINEYYKDKCYDCGISTENEGKYLNEGLIHFKEEFGARGVAYDFYEMKI
ncbi:MAG: GNAT family N-acetyltransferase [Methanobacterium sp.]